MTQGVVAITGLIARRRLAVAAAALLACATVAAAGDFPALKPGLWEFQRTLFTAQTERRKPPTQTIRRCTSPTEDMQKKWETLGAQSCRFSPIEHTENRYSYRSMCRRNALEVRIASTITVESDSEYRVETQSVNASGATRELLVAHRLGDCAN